MSKKKTKKINQKQLLNLLLAVSFVIILLNDFFLSETSEIVPFGDELGSVLSNLSLAYISSFIFYCVVVVLKEKRDKKNIYFTVYEWTNQLIGRAYSVYHYVIIPSGVNQADYDKKLITKEQFTALCNLGNPNAIAENIFLGTHINPQPATYGQLIYNNSVSNVDALTKKIFNYMPFLDTEFVKLINKLHSSTFFLVAPTFLYQSNNTDFSVYADNMFEFLEFVRELDNYNSTINKKLIDD
ncbi:hypothetical protein [Flavobacterium sp. IB48]|uniref:hypothetical protein n=1 Tax=Flavobacterium sp. IB48 TaxID=2779375 RepID=UPI0018E863CD|nr:hypothetical protein [Flavobacterium sp. IB48]MBJ2125857.1 hypothetical protein [Flavobacterium sp. IB48]